MNLPPDFPVCTDDELVKAIADLSKTFQGNMHGTTESMRWGPLLQIVLGEQQARQTRRSNTTALRNTRVTLTAAIVTLIFSVVAAGLGSQRFVQARTGRLGSSLS